MPSDLLTAKEMAAFVADGYLAFPGIVPEAINQAAQADIEAGEIIADCGYRGERFAERYVGSALGQVFGLPRVAGAIRSLVGPEPIFDHHCLHVQPANGGGGSWHADATIDAKRHFDIQLMYFPHDTPREMGGTMILPGSQFRIVHESEVTRYKNFVGQRATVCPAGTVLVLHHNLWHTGQPNRTPRRRLMFKIRLAASRPQTRLFDTRDLDDPEVGRILGRPQPWMGTDGRIELINRIRLWRQLIGDESWDLSYWVGRLENDPAHGVARYARGTERLARAS
jgi:hypothetical protein